MGKIANIVESSIAGLTGIMEFRRHPAELKDIRSKNPAMLEERLNFRSFIFNEKRNIKLLIIALVGSIIQLIIFKLLYPFPDFISDSYSYIATNLYNMDVNLWPIGYSKFLWLVHQISFSDTFLISIQYAFLQITSAYFFFTLCYLYQPSKGVSIAIFIFLFFNPLFLYLSNCVLSDALFGSLSIIWFTQILWMLKTPKTYHLIVLTVLTGLLFTIRYTAIYYPFVMTFALILTRFKPTLKLAGIVAPWLLIVPFILYTQKKTQEITGSKQFSVFGGWQLANNALYMYDHIEVDSSDIPTEARQFDHLVKRYFHAVPPEVRELSHFPGTFFIKHSEAPLKQYMFRNVKESNWGFVSWGKVSPMYSKYGTWLISHYPLAFAKYYLLLNTRNYFVPHLEKFGSYNIEMDSVWQEAKIWFHYPSTKINVVSKTFQGDLFFMFPTLFLLLNALFIFYFIRLYLLNKPARSGHILYPSVQVTASFLLMNFCFSIWATPVVLRYQIIPMTLLFSFSLLMMERLSKMVKTNS